MDMKDIFELLLHYAKSHTYSDIHLNTNSYPIVRDKSGEITKVQELLHWEEQIQLRVLTSEDIWIVKEILLEWNNDSKNLKYYEIDISYNNKNINTRYRVNIYKDTKWYSIAMRTFPEDIPTIESLWLWDQIKSLCNKSKWLVLMTGPTWSWKSTNLAAMIEYINTNYKKHIITIEDPVEFTFHNKKSLINQREIWIHTHDFAGAMRSCLREDPDVIMIWEMRDPETIKAAITLAETWHLVFSTLHTNDTVQSIDRIIDVFPSDQQWQVRMQLAMSLAWVIAQRLVPVKWEEKLMPVREVLLNNDAVRNLIISWKTHQLYSVIEVSQKQWMILMDSYLIALFKKWYIDEQTLMSFARDKENIESFMN